MAFEESREKLGIIGELWAFMRVRKKWWLGPIVVMLALLASVFFSGFILELNQFSPIVQAASNLVPVTHGIKMAQELLLRGTLEEPWRYAVLAGEGAGVSILSWLVLRRNLATSRK